MTERTFHTLFALVLAGLILTGVAQGRGLFRHGDQHCEVMTK